MKVYVLNPMAFDGKGPSQTCVNIAEAAGAAGDQVHVLGTRRRLGALNAVSFTAPFGNVGRVLPYKKVEPMLMRGFDSMARRMVPDGAVVYAWPAVRGSLLHELKDRGCAIAMEFINPHTRYDKALLDTEWAAEKLDYPHFVSDAVIANQEQSLQAVDLCFAPNQFVTESLLQNGVPRSQIVETRYGCKPLPEKTDYAVMGKTRFITIGTVEARKGCHLLLRAWKESNAAEVAELHFYGAVDPNFAAAYPHLLEQDGVVLAGYSNDILTEMQNFDAFVFLSLSEGGPQVSQEAAAHGLPMILSPMGGGRFVEAPGGFDLVDPHETKLVGEAIRRMATYQPWRESIGRQAFAKSKDFTWKRAAEERMDGLRASFTVRAAA